MDERSKVEGMRQRGVMLDIDPLSSLVMKRREMLSEMRLSRVLFQD